MDKIAAFFKRDKTASMTPDERLQQMRTTSKQLEKRITHLRSCIITERRTIDANARNRNVALVAFKRMRTYEQQVVSLEQMRMNLDKAIFAVDNNASNVAAIGAMRDGKKLLQSMAEQVEVEEVDNLVFDLSEELKTQAQVTQALTNQIGDSYDDDDDLNAELDAMEAQKLEAQLAAQLPSPLDRRRLPLQSSAASASATMPSPPTAAMAVSDANFDAADSVNTPLTPPLKTAGIFDDLEASLS